MRAAEVCLWVLLVGTVVFIAWDVYARRRRAKGEDDSGRRTPGGAA